MSWAGLSCSVVDLHSTDQLQVINCDATVRTWQTCGSEPSSKRQNTCCDLLNINCWMPIYISPIQNGFQTRCAVPGFAFTSPVCSWTLMCGAPDHRSPLSVATNDLPLTKAKFWSVELWNAIPPSNSLSTTKKMYLLISLWHRMHNLFTNIYSCASNGTDIKGTVVLETYCSYSAVKHVLLVC